MRCTVPSSNRMEPIKARQTSRHTEKKAIGVKSCGQIWRILKQSVGNKDKKDELEERKRKKETCKLVPQIRKLHNRLTCDCLCGNGRGTSESSWIDSLSPFFNYQLKTTSR